MYSFISVNTGMLFFQKRIPYIQWCFGHHSRTIPGTPLQISSSTKICINRKIPYHLPRWHLVEISVSGQALMHSLANAATDDLGASIIFCNADALLITPMTKRLFFLVHPIKRINLCGFIDRFIVSCADPDESYRNHVQIDFFHII